MLSTKSICASCTRNKKCPAAKGSIFEKDKLFKYTPEAEDYFLGNDENGDMPLVAEIVAACKKYKRRKLEGLKNGKV